MTPPTYRYPDTYEERVLWHEKGTPAPWTPYTREAPDALRDGLLKGWREHAEKRA
jgi:hypothetical protein